MSAEKERIKLAIFDLDDTLIHEGFNIPRLCDDTIKVLNTLKDKEYRLIIATFNKDAVMILRQLGLYSMFDIVLTSSGSLYYKSTMIKSIMAGYIKDGYYVDKKNIYFFDDMEDNIEDVLKLMENAILVNYNTGITMDDIKDLP